MGISRNILAAGAVLWALAAGCGGPGGSGGAGELQKPISPPVPKIENVTVDFALDEGALQHRAVGYFRPGTQPNPPAEMLATIKPLIEPIPALQVTLGDVVKYDGAFPGQNKNWSKWDQGVEAQVRKYLSEARRVEWEVWNEPDNKNNFKGSQNEFFAVWLRTVGIVRRVDPSAVISGPNTSNDGWVSEFLKIAKDGDAAPNLVTFNVDLRADIRGKMGAVSEAFWQDGTDHTRLRIGQNGQGQHKYSPSDPVLLIAGFQDAARDNAKRGVEERLRFKLSHLVTRELKPKSVYWAWRQYAEMRGRLVKVSGAPTADGVAAVDGSARTCTVLIGRNPARTATPNDKLKPLNLVLKNMPGSAVQASARIIPDLGDKAMETLPPLTVLQPFYRNNEAVIALTDLGAGQAMELRLAFSGRPATTQSATQPAAAK